MPGYRQPSPLAAECGPVDWAIVDVTVRGTATPFTLTVDARPNQSDSVRRDDDVERLDSVTVSRSVEVQAAVALSGNAGE